MDQITLNSLIKDAYEAIEIGSSELLKITRVDTGYRNAQGDLLRVIRDKYSNILHALIRIPVFVKANIISSKEVNVDGFRQINLTLKPEFILKGKESFLLQPQFDVYYREYNYVTEKQDFKIGKSYLFPLWDRGEPGNKIFSVATFISGDESRFLIEDNMLHDDNNFFNLTTVVNWVDFLKKINIMITDILNKRALDRLIPQK